MSKHAEFEASIRDLPPIILAKLKKSKIKTLRDIKLNEKNKGNLGYVEQKWDTNKFFVKNKNDFKEIGPGLLSAVCVLDKDVDAACGDLSADAFNNLCLVESITNGKEPSVVCDEQWIADIGADATKIAEFETGYDLWKSLFLTSVKWLMKNQSAIKLKQHVTISLGYRQDNFAGDFVDKVCFEENAWKKAFGKLQDSTKICEQTFWVLAYFFHVDRDLKKIPSKSQAQPFKNSWCVKKK